MAGLVDSSVVIAAERRTTRATELFGILQDSPLFINGVIASELFAGIHRAESETRGRSRQAFVDEVLAQFPLAPFDLDVARRLAEVRFGLERAGQIIGGPDLIIAATALTFGYTLYTQNLREFARVPGLVVLQPQWPA